MWQVGQHSLKFRRGYIVMFDICTETKHFKCYEIYMFQSVKIWLKWNM